MPSSAATLLMVCKALRYCGADSVLLGSTCELYDQMNQEAEQAEKRHTMRTKGRWEGSHGARRGRNGDLSLGACLHADLGGVDREHALRREGIGGFKKRAQGRVCRSAWVSAQRQGVGIKTRGSPLGRSRAGRGEEKMRGEVSVAREERQRVGGVGLVHGGGDAAMGVSRAAEGMGEGTRHCRHT